MLGAAFQSQPEVQSLAQERSNFIQRLTSMVEDVTLTLTLRRRAVYALGNLVRGHSGNLEVAFESGCFGRLVDILRDLHDKKGSGDRVALRLKVRETLLLHCKTN